STSPRRTRSVERKRSRKCKQDMTDTFHLRSSGGGGKIFLLDGYSRNAGPPGGGRGGTPPVVAPPGPARARLARGRSRAVATAAPAAPWSCLMPHSQRSARSSWSSLLWSARKRAAAPARRRRPPLAVEVLEDRTVLDGTVKLSNGTLTIT